MRIPLILTELFVNFVLLEIKKIFLKRFSKSGNSVLFRIVLTFQVLWAFRGPCTFISTGKHGIYILVKPKSQYWIKMLSAVCIFKSHVINQPAKQLRDPIVLWRRNVFQKPKKCKLNVQKKSADMCKR